MKISLLTALFIFTTFTTFDHSNAQAYGFLTTYYNCFDPSASIYNDSYWQSTLRGITDFKSAMNYYQQLFRNVSACTVLQCRCMSWFSSGFNYTFYFLNERIFNDLYKLSEQVKLKYKPKTIEQISNDIVVPVSFDPSVPTLANFVLNYDWANALSVYYYEATQNCIFSKNEKDREELSLKCQNKYPTDLDMTLKCIIKEYKCSIEAKNYIVTGYIITNDNPTFESLYDRVKFFTGASNRLSSSSPIFFVVFISSFIYKLAS